MFELIAQGNAPGIFEVLIGAAAQAPALVVLCIVVYVFLSHIKDSQKMQADSEAQFEERQKARDVHIEHLGDTCHAFQQSLAADSKAFHRDLSETTAEAMAECRHVIKEASIVMAGVKNELVKRT